MRSIHGREQRGRDEKDVAMPVAECARDVVLF